jgi:hypothetical protein
MDREELIARSLQIYETRLKAELERTRLNSFVAIRARFRRLFSRPNPQ